MCGITGFLAQSPAQSFPTIIETMTDRLHHRGPDDRGVWLDDSAGVALGHRRLSVIDLSSAAHQPMLSASGRYVIAFNGEIYNHLELRRQLASSHQGAAWRGHSDTETLLACFDAWGFEKTLQASNGMFALAVWDRQRSVLMLARDRIGEKPLYYGWQGDVFLFGSELKALQAHPRFDAEIDRGALSLFLRHNYIPGPHCIYRGIQKLSPGTWLEVSHTQRDAAPVRYWDLAAVAEAGIREPFRGSDSEAILRLDTILLDAVKRQLLSDVPLGALLSGGIDSSSICALMQANSMQPIKSFTIGFNEAQYNEAVHARAIARHLGTDHTELQLDTHTALTLVQDLPGIWDEPFADSSQLPTVLVMQLARKSVTVALSGDGGDEMFCGYNRYRHAPKLAQRLGWMPPLAHHCLAMLLTAVPATTMNRLLGAFTTRHGISLPGDKAHKLGGKLRDGDFDSIDRIYAGLVTEWPAAETLVVNGTIPANLLDERQRWPQLADPVARMMALDGLTYLPDDILVKVDRAAMAVSLETRAPFLDKHVIEFAWSLPMHFKQRDGQGKWLLRRLLDRYVPDHLTDRPKMGFGVPLDEWLRGPLRDWAETLLDENRLVREGFFHPSPVRQAWERHLGGRDNHGHRLWSILMFQSWLEARA